MVIIMTANTCMCSPGVAARRGRRRVSGVGVRGRRGVGGRAVRAAGRPLRAHPAVGVERLSRAAQVCLAGGGRVSRGEAG